MLLTTLKEREGERKLDFAIFAFRKHTHTQTQKKSSRPEYIFPNAGEGVNWGSGQCFAPQMGSSVCEHQCGSWQGLSWGGVGGDGGGGGGKGGWADCNGTCSNSNYPWTHAAVEDLLGPRVAFIMTRHRQVFLVSASVMTPVRTPPPPSPSPYPCSSLFTCYDKKKITTPQITRNRRRKLGSRQTGKWKKNQ